MNSSSEPASISAAPPLTTHRIRYGPPDALQSVLDRATDWDGAVDEVHPVRHPHGSVPFLIEHAGHRGDRPARHELLHEDDAAAHLATHLAAHVEPQVDLLEMYGGTAPAPRALACPGT